MPGPVRSRLREWRANEAVVLERNDNYYGHKAKPLPASSIATSRKAPTQRLMLEKGDIDIARNLEPGDLDAISHNADLTTTSAPKGTVYYISLNQKNEKLAKPEVREAFKYLVDYDAIGSTIIKGIGEIHQTFLPKGILGASDDNPLQARRRQGQGAAGQGRARGRLRRHDGRAQQSARHRARRVDPADRRPGRHQDRDHSRRRQADADQVSRPQS